MNLTRTDLGAIAGIFLFAFLCFVAGWLLGPLFLSAAAALAVALLGGLVLEGYRRTHFWSRKRHQRSKERQRRYYEQTEALLVLSAALPLRAVLPATRGWAASPDLLRVVARTIREQQPESILEIGSGVSTVVAGYCLEKAGKGRTVALEHEAAYAQKSAREVEAHDLSGYATVRHAPLREWTLEGTEEETWLWYDFEEDDFETPVDLVIVDAPPRVTQPCARYPALPVLREYLSPGAVIILDDADRESEKEAVRRWQHQFKGIDVEYIDTEKGACIIRMAGEAEQQGQTHEA